MLRPNLVTSIRAVFLFLCLIDPTIVSAAPTRSPVDPRVWEDTENGGTAHFLILLKDQTTTKSKAKQQRIVKSDEPQW